MSSEIIALKSDHTREPIDYDELVSCFPPGYSPRGLQLQALKDFVETYNNPLKTFMLCELPVGAGKSLFAATIGRYFEKKVGKGKPSAYYLTLTQQLQDQYSRDFHEFGFENLLGKAKFRCKRDPRNSCAEGPHASPACSLCTGMDCTYRAAKAEALAAPHTVANYHSFYFNIGRVSKTEDAPDNRPLLVVDECHSLESFLLDQVGVTVDIEKLSGIIGQMLPPLPHPVETEDEDVEDYLTYAKDVIIPRVVDYASNAKRRGILPPKTAEELTQLINKLTYALKTPQLEWIPERGEGRDGKRSPRWFALKPLYVNHIAPLMYSSGDFQIFMSGTILNPGQFCKSLGLEPSKGLFFTYDSPFKPENRRVIVRKLDMTRKSAAENWPVMGQVMQAILAHHHDVKGLILTPSNKMLDYIEKGDKSIDGGEWPGLPLNLRQRLIRAAGENRTAEYERHKASAGPSVLFASGYWEGADLKGDAARFVIIPSVPRPLWQGQIKARGKRDNDWYKWLTFTKMLQGLGRGVRSEDDFCITYVLDRDFAVEVLKKDRNGNPAGLVPLWVRSAVEIMEDAPAEEAEVEEREPVEKEEPVKPKRAAKPQKSLAQREKAALKKTRK